MVESYNQSSKCIHWLYSLVGSNRNNDAWKITKLKSKFDTDFQSTFMAKNS
jgi:hypothetical protein